MYTILREIYCSVELRYFLRFVFQTGSHSLHHRTFSFSLFFSFLFFSLLFISFTLYLILKSTAGK